MLPIKAHIVLNGWLSAASPVIKKVTENSELTWEEIRQKYMAGMEILFPPLIDVNYHTSDLGGVNSLICEPVNLKEEQRIVLYIHGGGYVHGGVNAYKGLCGRLSKMLGAKVYIPDYRQAPEFPFPLPIEDVFLSYKALLAKGIDHKNIALAGDSAGGAMVVTIMRMALNAGLALPAVGVAFSPWANLTHSGLSAKTRNGVDPICSTDFLDKLADIFLAGEIASHPDASPVFANVEGLSPILIQIGENEVMLSDALRLGTKLAEAKVRTSIEVWPGMFHVWHLFAGILPEADDALKNAVSFINQIQANDI